MCRPLCKNTLSLLGLLAMLTLGPAAQSSEDPSVRVRMQTSEGDIVLQLNSKQAAKTVENFLGYVNAGYYEGTIFHRVIEGFMIQGGGYDDRFSKKPTRLAIRNEADNGLKNKRGSIAMARTNDPHSATAQFFINLADNAFLDHRDPTPSGWGYTVFGQVVEGMDIVSKIGRVKTGPAGPFPTDYPRKPIHIQKVTVEQTGNTGSK